MFFSAPTYLVRVQRDPQPQFGHPVLLQQLQVRTERHAERPGHVLRQPAVVGRVAQTVGLIFALEEKHLRETGILSTCGIIPSSAFQLPK